jgi:hypothetical protein
VFTRLPVAKKKTDVVAGGVGGGGTGSGPVPPPADPFDTGGDEPNPAYEEQVKVPREFKERLQRAAAYLNGQRKRRGQGIRALGYYVAKHLDHWLFTIESRAKAEEDARRGGAD